MNHASNVTNDLFDLQLREWNDYYKLPAGKVRLAIKLTKPRLILDGHMDYHYFSDEFTIIFNAIRKDDFVLMLVEGPHIDPKGERIPILSTWGHIKVSLEDVHKSGTQYSFVFYDNKWWDAEFSYNYENYYNPRHNIDIRPAPPITWCNCDYEDGPSMWMTPNVIRKQRKPFSRWPGPPHSDNFYPSYNLFTIFKDTNCTEFGQLVNSHYDREDILGIIGDFLEEQSDPFHKYLREMMCLKRIHNLRELGHICRFFVGLKNDRAAKLLLLAEGIGLTK